MGAGQKTLLPAIPEAAFWTTPVGPVPPSSFQDFGMFLLVFFPTLSVVVCALRLYSKHMAKRLWIDDWIILLAVILIVPQAVFAAIFLKCGYWGIHDADIPPHPRNLGYFWNYLNQVVYNPILSLVKVSALLFLLRVGGTKKRVKLACTAMIWFNLLQLFSFLPVVVFQCDPVEWNWRGSAQGKCIKGAVFSTTLAAINLLTDMLTLWIPFWAFLDLKVNKRVRNALLGVFCVGILVICIGAVRLYSIIRSFYLKPEDNNWTLGYTTNTIEINLSVLAASAPALWPLARRWFPRAFQSLGLDRPYLYPDIEVGYATQKSRASQLTTPTKSLRVKVSWKEHRKTPSWVDRGVSPAVSTEEVLGGIHLQQQQQRPRANTNTSTVRSGRSGGTRGEGNTSPRSWDTFYDERTDDDEDDDDESRDGVVVVDEDDDAFETYHGVIRPSPTKEYHHHNNHFIGQAR
ncbi:hypothetical protein B0H66DRAFT_66210 [Apodospora peruviana]|uniref:Rhodopsin domain-containing protein n=1 Tax=Apodospora peruviana TaxID=516989 RepID=A0AAE0MFD4_9PEZI|nr:hypothetical protein B0H66DRAFT_66210 [Apodospora peruviana]